MNYARRLTVATAMVIGSTISAAPANALDLTQRDYINSFLERNTECGYFTLNDENRARAYKFFDDGVLEFLTRGREGAYAPMNSPSQNFQAELCGIRLHFLGTFHAAGAVIDTLIERIK